MEKLNKKKLVITIIIVLVVIALITLIVIFSKKNNNVDETFEKAGSISKTESDFEELKVKDIELTYKEDKSETILDFAIENTTDQKVEKQTINIHLLDENGGLIAGVQTYVETIDANKSHPVNMMLAGNIQGIKTIKLVKSAE